MGSLDFKVYYVIASPKYKIILVLTARPSASETNSRILVSSKKQHSYHNTVLQYNFRC
jgi:hypothetical protein